MERLMTEKEATDRIESLAQIALPMVREHLETEDVLDYVGSLSVEFGNSTEFAEIYYIRVPLKDDTWACNVQALAAALNAYCTNEDTDAIYTAPEFTCDGREWMIGDGDDAGAVVFHGKAFRIWLRSFAP
jgi:hypothetical protein